MRFLSFIPAFLVPKLNVIALPAQVQHPHYALAGPDDINQKYMAGEHQFFQLSNFVEWDQALAYRMAFQSLSPPHVNHFMTKEC